MGSIRSFPWDSVNTNPDITPPKWDRPSSAKDFRDVMSKFFSTGVFMDQGTSLQVVAASGMSVTVKKGSAIVNGTVAINDADEAISLSGSDPSLPRIDTIVARWNANNDARYIKLFVLKGNAASSPVRPVLTRNESVYEIGLADVYVPAGSTSITQQRITDTRLETERCGASAPYEEFDTSALYDQLKQATKDAVDAMNDALDGTTAGNLKKYCRSLRVENEIPDNADLNTYKIAGNYGYSAVGNISNIKHRPSGLKAPFLMFVHNVGSAVMQEVIDASGLRWCRSGEGSWDRTVDSTYIVPTLLSKAFPVGSVYMSFKDVSPASFIGGTWQRITGRFLYCTTNTNTGGSNTHTNTVDEMASHSHTARTSVQLIAGGTTYYGEINDQSNANTGINNPAGGGKSYSIMPAYQGVYAWRRTA